MHAMSMHEARACVRAPCRALSEFGANERPHAMARYCSAALARTCLYMYMLYMYMQIHA